MLRAAVVVLLVAIVSAQAPALKVVKRTNGIDTNINPIPRLRVGSLITWTYEVTNTGSKILSGVRVTDDKLPGTAIHCPATPANLLASAVMVCSAVGTAAKCGYCNHGCATATGYSTPVCYQSCYNGVRPSISVTKYTNYFTNEDLKNATNPPCIRRCDPVTWAYVVSNTGDELLTNVRVVDNQLSAAAQPSCPITKLAPWWSVTCFAYGQASVGPYTNFATAYGSPTVGGTDVWGWDKNTFLGTDPRIELVVTVNGVVAQSGADVLSNPVASPCAAPVYGEGGEGKSGKSGKSGEGEGASKASKASKSGSKKNQPRVVYPKGFEIDPAAELEKPATIVTLGKSSSKTSSSEGEGDSGKNKAGNSGQKDGSNSGPPPAPTYPDGTYVLQGGTVAVVVTIKNAGTEAFEDVFLRLPDAGVDGHVQFFPYQASDFTCTGDYLPVGGTITCTAPTFANTLSGKQYVTVGVEAWSVCTQEAESVQAQGKWYTPVATTPAPPPPTTTPSSGGSGEGSSEGEGGSKNSAAGCNSAYWAMAPASAYPSGWTANTAFYKAAGLSKDPLSGQSLQQVLNAMGDGLNAFYRAAATALLNAATVPHFALSKWEVQSRIESALSRYFRSGSSDTSGIDLWRKQFDGYTHAC